MVFAEFRDQISAASPCSLDPWPATPDSVTSVSVPAWAPTLIDSVFSPSTVLIDSSLTAYFALMSKDDLVITGEVYPKVVLMPDSLRVYNGYPSLSGLDSVMVDALLAVDSDTSFVIDSRFDIFDEAAGIAGSDGLLAIVYVISREHRFTADSTLFGNSGTTAPSFSGTLLLGPDSLALDRWARVNHYSGTRGFWTALEIAAHELGHNLTPASFPSLHANSIERYGLMWGNGAFRKGPVRCSTSLRYELGWIAPVADLTAGSAPLTAASETTLVLRDVISYPDSGFAIVRTADPEQYFILECNDPSSVYLFSADDCLSSPEGSGLMVYHVSTKSEPGSTDPEWGWKSSAFNLPPFIDPEIAPGMFDTTGVSYAPDPASGFDAISINEGEYKVSSGPSDFFRDGAGESSLFGPYTNPSSNLYWYADSTTYWNPSNISRRQEQSVYSGLTFHDIHWVTQPGSGEGRMSVTVRYDPLPAAGDGYRLPPGTAIDGTVQLTADVHVASEDTVTVNDGARFIISAHQDHAASGSDTSLVEIAVDGHLEHAGGALGIEVTSSRDDTFTHDLGGVTILGEVAPADSGDWYGMRLGPTGTVAAESTVFKYAAAALAISDSLFPALIAHAPSTGVEFQYNLLDVLFDRDIVIPDSVTVPAGCVVGFTARQDAFNIGVDPSSVEIITRPTGQLVLESGAILRSAGNPPVAGDWYGIRIPDLDLLTANGATVAHARGAVSYEASDWPSSYTSLASGLTFSQNICEFTKDRDYTVSSGTLSIPSGWSVGFTSGRDSASAGKDPNRSELILAGGALDLDGTLRSDDPDSTRGSWYGIRVTDVTDVTALSSGGQVREAGGALSLEGATAAGVVPDEGYFSQFTGKVGFSNNQSDLCFDRDIKVASGDSMMVPPGWRIGFTEHADSNNVGVSALCELIIQGTLVAGDTTGGRAVFTGNGVAGAISDTAWFGISHEEAYESIPAGYGYFFKNVPTAGSRLVKTDLEGAQYAMLLKSLAAPEIVDVGFLSPGADPASPVHVFLDATDVVVPFEKKWSLNAGTFVVAADSTSSGNDYNVGGVTIGESGKVDLIVQGALNTSGTASDQVRFQSVSKDGLNGDDWGGIYMDWSSGESVISQAKLRYAANPIFFFYPNGPQLLDCKINSYADCGVWILEGYGDGVTVARNTIARLNTLSPAVGKEGIRIEKTVSGLTEDNVLTLAGTPPSFSGSLVVSDTWQWGTKLGAGTDTLVIQGNKITGVLVPNMDRSGVTFSSVVRPGGRHVVFAGNEVSTFTNYGLRFEYSDGISVDCNLVYDCDGPVWHKVGATGMGGPVEFDGNNLYGVATDSVRTALPVVTLERANNPSANAGVLQLVQDNVLRVWDPDREYLKENATDSLDVYAGNNAWMIQSLGDSVEVDADSVWSRMTLTSPGGVAVAPLLATRQDCAAEPGGPGTGRQPSQPPGALQPGTGDPVAHAELAAPRPNPGTGITTLEFSLLQAGSVSLEVFDVAGRRVRELVSARIDAGRYRVAWDGRSQSGHRVASGTYFVRLRQGSDVIGVRKVVRVQ